MRQKGKRKYRSITQKYIRLIIKIILVLIALLATQKVWEPFLVSNFVNPFIKPVFEQKYIGYPFYIAMGLVIVLYLPKLLKLRQPNKISLILISIFAIAYYANRFDWFASNFGWCFYPDGNWFKFLDAVVLIWILLSLPIPYCFSMAYPRQKKTILEQEITPAQIPLASDSDIKNDDEDRLGRVPFVTRLCEKFINIENKDSYSIGIEAEWGEGKSSFLNLIKNHLTKDKTLAYVIEFSPYDSYSCKNLIYDFFSKLEKELKPINPNLGNLVHRYAESLTGFKVWGFSFGLLPFLPQNTITDKKRLVSEGVEQLDKPLVILIDELDRVEKSEILAVLQLIAHTAKFKNTIFITAYSSAYITSTLDQIFEPDKFLEKFFNQTYTLPKPDAEKLKDEAKRLLIKILGEKNGQDIDKFFQDFNGTYNLRTIKRLASSTYSAIDLINNDGIGNNILLYDLILIQYLELLSPRFYRALGNSPHQFLESYGVDNNKVYVLPKEIPENTKLSEDFPFDEIAQSRLHAEFIKSHNKTGDSDGGNKTISENEYIQSKIKPYCNSNEYKNFQTVYSILQLLFGEIENENHYVRLKNHIRFNDYFYKQLNENQISEKEFSDLLNSTEDIEPKVKNWLNSEKYDSLIMWMQNFEVTKENVPQFYELSFCIDKNTEKSNYGISIPYFNAKPRKYSQEIKNKIVDVFNNEGYLEQKIKMLSILLYIYNSNGNVFLKDLPNILTSCLNRFWETNHTDIFTGIPYENIFFELRELLNNSQNQINYTQSSYDNLINTFKQKIKGNIRKWYEYLIIELNGNYSIRFDTLGFRENEHTIFNTSDETIDFLEELKPINKNLYNEFISFYETYKKNFEKTNSNEYIPYKFDALYPKYLIN